MLKKSISLLVLLVLILTSCARNVDEQMVTKDEDIEIEQVEIEDEEIEMEDEGIILPDNANVIAAGGNHTIALRKDGTVTAIGDDGGGGTVNVSWWENIRKCSPRHELINLFM